MPEECGRLIRTAQKEYDGACLPAAVLMLYAGVRPQEVRRLRFRHLRLENGELIIPSTHSKTGGSRLVTLQPVALRFLRSFRRVPPDTFICPKGWERKWREVRVRAGWNKTTLGRRTYCAIPSPAITLRPFGIIPLFNGKWATGTEDSCERGI